MTLIKGLTAVPILDSEAASKKYVDDGRFDIYETETTIDDTPLPINILTLANNTSYTFDISIVGRLNDTAVNKSVGGFLRFGVFRNNSGSATIIGTRLKEIDDHGTSGYDFDVTVSGNNVRVSVTGAAAEVVNWTIGGNIVTVPDSGELALGGTITEIIDGGNDYRVHTFTDVGTDSFVVLAASLDVEYLVVAGAGGGGVYGAGGAGGLLTNVGGSPLTLTVGIKTITVGAGGAGATVISPNPATTKGGSGGNSLLAGSVTTTGGGGGGSQGTVPGVLYDGATGGSGGGGSTINGIGGAGTGGQGNAGGNGDNNTGSGGGGGAGGVGSNGFGGVSGGAGGAGLSNTITGTATTYAGGGGGGARNDGTAGAGGSGGGGNGSNTHTASGSAGQTNRGSGGGGGGRTILTADSAGGNGGSGIVIIRYQI